MNETHRHPHTDTKRVLNRMSRAIGHMESVRAMIEEGRDCAEVLIQIAAVNNIGKLILTDHLRRCVVDAARAGDGQALDELAAALYALSTPASKLLLGQIGPTMLAALLYLGAGLGMGALGCIRRRFFWASSPTASAFTFMFTRSACSARPKPAPITRFRPLSALRFPFWSFGRRPRPGHSSGECRNFPGAIPMRCTNAPMKPCSLS